MNHKKNLLALLFLLFCASLFGLPDFSDFSNFPYFSKTTTKTTVKDKISVDFRLNFKNDDGKNHLKWENSSKKIEDKYDAVSGASVSHSTGELLTLFRNGNSQNFLAPKGLRSLLLFAVSSPDFLQKDNLEIQQESDGKITIKFNHRKNKYFIQTDKKGKLDLEKSFFILVPEKENKNLAENQNPEQNQNLAKNQDEDSSQTNADENQISENNQDENQNPKNENLENQNENSNQIEEKNENSEAEKENPILDESFKPDKTEKEPKYIGKLKVSLKKDILTIKGKIKLIEIVEEDASETKNQ